MTAINPVHNKHVWQMVTKILLSKVRPEEMVMLEVRTRVTTVKHLLHPVSDTESVQTFSKKLHGLVQLLIHVSHDLWFYGWWRRAEWNRRHNCRKPSSRARRQAATSITKIKNVNAVNGFQLLPSIGSSEFCALLPIGIGLSNVRSNIAGELNEFTNDKFEINEERENKWLRRM